MQRSPLESRPPTAKAPGRSARVSFMGDDHALIAALGRGDRGAAAALFDRYSALVERTAARVMGANSELSDVVQDAFLRMLRSTHLIRDPQALPEWVIRITVCTASDFLRRKRRRWWLYYGPSPVAEPEILGVDTDGREALRAAYAVLAKLSIEDRAAFSLRFIEGMELQRVANACDCSLATIKRRLDRAEARFRLLSRDQPALREWLGKADRGAAGELQ